VPNRTRAWLLVALPVSSTLVGCEPPLVSAPTTAIDPPPTLQTDRADDDDDVGPGDDDDEGAPFRLDAVVPRHGTAGHEVELRGGPFPTDSVILFGDDEATVLTYAPDRLTVRVPDLGLDDVVDITVASELAASPDALDFNYYEDATGRIGAIGIVEFGAHRGGYWADTVIDDGWSQVIFTMPTDLGWEHLAYAGGPDRCERDWALDEEIFGYDPELATVELTNGGPPLPLEWDPVAYGFVSGPLPTEPGAAYDLLPMAGNPDWPAFDVAGLSGTLPTAMDLVSPDIDQDTFASVPESFSLSWQGPYDGDLVLVWMTRQTWDGQAFQAQESVSCWLVDDGAFVVPDLWDDWDESDDYVYFAIGRANRPRGVILPHNNGRSEVLGVYWAVGFLDAE
jgi:hypothetical protein